MPKYIILYVASTVEPRYNEVLGTMKITLLYQVSHYIRVKKQRTIKSWDQQNDLVIRGFCYIRPLYNEVPLYIYNHKNATVASSCKAIEWNVAIFQQLQVYMAISGYTWLLRGVHGNLSVSASATDNSQQPRRPHNCLIDPVTTTR